MNILEKIQAAANAISEKTAYRPKLALVLGSGLGGFAETLTKTDLIKYEEIPFFPTSTVPGHAGQLVIQKDVLCMQGRFHFYEGYPMEEVTFPIRVLKSLGVQTIILTNAAGGINPAYSSGDLVLLSDHINFMGTNPLIGPNLDEFGERFPDLSQCYDVQLITAAKRIGEENNISLKTGTYMAFSGPSFETPAEIRMAKTLGADAVGMSTVPEAIVAKHCGMAVLGISCITNMAAGITSTPLTHAEVMDASQKAKPKLVLLLTKLMEYVNGL